MLFVAVEDVVDDVYACDVLCYSFIYIDPAILYKRAPFLLSCLLPSNHATFQRSTLCNYVLCYIVKMHGLIRGLTRRVGGVQNTFGPPELEIFTLKTPK